MSARDSKRYYWLKLKKDFFQRHEIRIIESLPNGKEYLLFYLKLMCEATSHEGNLRFSDCIPYSEEMLSTITNTNIDVVRSAIKYLSDLKLMEILDDGTIYLEEVKRLTGSETGQTIRKNEAKVVKNTAPLPLSYPNRTLEQEQEIELEIEKDIYKAAAKYKEAGYDSSMIEFAKDLLQVNNISKIDVAFDKAIEIIENEKILNKGGYFREVAERENW